MGKRYSALRVIGNIYKILGIFVAVLTIISIIGICGMSLIGGTAIDAFANQYGNESGSSGLLGGAFGGVIFGIVAMIYGGITSITLYGFGEAVYLLIALEENTRTTALLLQQKK
jgi:hypothetical protein